MDKKHILGLDLGTNSIGWALIERINDKVRLVSLGVRRIMDPDIDKFEKGQSITTNANRTLERTNRKTLNRYQMRRAELTQVLNKYDMWPGEKLLKLPPLQLWQLRANAAVKQVGLKELGRILYHLNQKRGYKHGRGRDSEDKKQRDYVENINNRYAELKVSGETIGQHFAKKLEESAIASNDGSIFVTYRIKDQIYPRKAYEEEYDRILSCQQQFYPNILTNDLIKHIRNNIIYYQRNPRSCKHLVSECEFEQRGYKDKQGNLVFRGPKVAPKSSPLFQVCKEWESINNIVFKKRHNHKKFQSIREPSLFDDMDILDNDILYITQEQRHSMFEYMETHDRLKLCDVLRILGLNEHSGWYAGKAIGVGLQGNTTKNTILKALRTLPKEKRDMITRFELKITSRNEINENTGEVIRHIDSSYTDEPLYRLWHIIYSIQNDEERRNAISKFLQSFDIVDEVVVDKLCGIDFVKAGYGNKSAKAISKLLPYLMDGINYSDACEYVGYRHSDYLTKEENIDRELKDIIPAIKKNALRQPVVEKILNQTINIVNAVNRELRENGQGQVDIIRIELARELKMDRESRHRKFTQNNSRKRQNEEYADKINEHGIIPTRNRVIKYRLWEEANMQCFYCGQPINITELLRDPTIEKEHIIPKALLLDNSYSNLVCSCRKCNQEKGARTAYDYMRQKSDLDAYIKRINKLAETQKISQTKRLHLLASYEDYLVRKRLGKATEEDRNLWEEFINRQLSLSQYISRKAMEILQTGCRNVYATSGSITDIERHLWGYDTILHELNFPRYKCAGLTTVIKEEYEEGIITEKEVITNWSKRKDNRHHAIDALVIACTTQDTIQRINTLHASRDELQKETSGNPVFYSEKSTLLERWIKGKQPIPRHEVLEQVKQIAISIKAGKKVTTPGKRKTYKQGKPKLIQTGLLIPRGQLHEETIYGQINVPVKTKNGTIRQEPKSVVRYKLGCGKGFVFSGKETCKVEKDKKTDEYFITDEIDKALSYIVDKHIREVIRQRLNRPFPEGETYRTKAEQAQKDGRIYDGEEECKQALQGIRNLDIDPLFADKDGRIPILRVRCFTGLTLLQPLRYNSEGKPISFVSLGNNHHIALYKQTNGDIVEHVVTFWHAVERSTRGIPIVIKRPDDVWNDILNKPSDELPESFLNQLPYPNATYITSMQQNEMFILGMSQDEYQDAIACNNQTELCRHLYRVQSLSTNQYYFRLHIESENDKTLAGMKAGKFIRCKSIGSFLRLNPHKVTVTLLGKIIINNS